MKKLKTTPLPPEVLERRARWKARQLWQARLIVAYGRDKAREIVKG